MAQRLILIFLIATTCLLSSCIQLKVLRIRNEALQLFKAGKSVEAIRLIEKAMPEVEQELGPDHRYMGLAYHYLAVLYAYAHQDFERSEKYFLKALAIRTKTLGPEHRDTIETINLTGGLYRFTGDYSKAEAFSKRALELRTKVLGPDHPDTADSQIYLAYLYLRLGRYGEAEKLFVKASQNEQQEVDDRHPVPGEALAGLGHVYSSLGDNERAASYYRESLEIREKELGPEHNEVAKNLSSLGSVHQRDGELEIAEKYYRRALKINEKVFGRRNGWTAGSLEDMGSLYLAREEYDLAQKFFQEAKAIYQEVAGPDNPSTLSAQIALALLSIQRQDFNTAKIICQQVLASLGGHQAKPLLWNAQVVYSIVLARLGSDNAAIFFGKQAVNVIQGMRLGISGLESKLQRGFVLKREFSYRHLAALLIKQGRLPEAQQILTMLKEEEHFDFISRDTRRENVRKTNADYSPLEVPWLEQYRTINQRFAEIGREFEKLKRKKKLGLTEAEDAYLKRLRSDMKVAKRAFRQFLNELEKEMLKVSRGRAIEIAQKNLDKLKAMQGTLRELGQGVVLIHYLITDDNLYIILTTTQVQLVRNVAIRSPELYRIIHLLRKYLQNPELDPREPSKTLYEVMIAPIVDDLRQAKARTLMLSLDGALRYVPVSALYNGDRYMAEDYQIVMFTEAAQTKLTGRPSDLWSVAGFGVTRKIAGFSQLPAVKAELESIIRRDPEDADGSLPGIIYLDQTFTKEKIVDALDRGFPVLHIASHFVFQPGTERDSYLLLGDGNTLSLAEIIEDDFDFNNLDLLTLSACKTALGGAGVNGREIEGFGWLAQRQGAKAVLATLWRVADESTARFMENFYQLRQERRLTKVGALQQAQLEFIRSDRFGHPFFWAPFILMGNWL